MEKNNPYEPYIDGYDNLSIIQRKRNSSKELSGTIFHFEIRFTYHCLESEFNCNNTTDNIWYSRIISSNSLRKTKASEAMDFENKNKFAIKVDNALK